MTTTAHIEPRGNGSDAVTFTREGETLCTIHVRGYDGLVTWADKWEIVPDLVADGQLASVCRGPATYNHVDVYWV